MKELAQRTLALSHLEKSRKIESRYYSLQYIQGAFDNYLLSQPGKSANSYWLITQTSLCGFDRLYVNVVQLFPFGLTPQKLWFAPVKPWASEAYCHGCHLHSAMGNNKQNGTEQVCSPEDSPKYHTEIPTLFFFCVCVWHFDVRLAGVVRPSPSHLTSEAMLLLYNTWREVTNLDWAQASRLSQHSLIRVPGWLCSQLSNLSVN